MIKTDELLYQIDFKLNKLASNRHQAIPLEDKILALNEAQIRLINKKVNLNNLYKMGFDSFKSRYQDLQGLVVDYEKVKPNKTDSILGTYSFKVDRLKHPYYLPVDTYLIASNDVCSDKIIYIPRITKHGDVTTLLNNPHYSPSFRYQEGLMTISGDEFIFYTGGKFDVDFVLFSYIRYPKKIDCEGYIHLDGTPSINQDCELPMHIQDQLLELTVMELGFNTNNNNAAQAAIQKSQNSE